ncbi:MAG: hypothetical protein ALECFALPRED_005968 [Alectoria fallacina]|uniref:Flavoprotein domain-containing protein n=1 Tax=Alectoria fallacina TaxID=1903189 RepID=A0A8H3IDJ1_9LECA|nr:MAG: hypothetical protein ALECFALPRED_005968 [Alectoria fallacina]
MPESNEILTARAEVPIMRVNILVAQDKDFIHDPGVAFGVVEHLLNRQNIRTRYYDGPDGGLYDCRADEKKPMPSDELVEWTDLLVIACLSAGSLSRMLQGGTDHYLLEILRAWDVSKKILMIPGMTFAMWENPMTRKQISKIRRKWNWIRVLEPVLWHGNNDPLTAGQNWAGMDDLVQEVQNQADLISIGHDLEPISGSLQHSSIDAHPSQTQLPSEVWSLILEYAGDWEVAKSLDIYTNLPMPLEWRAHVPKVPGTPVDVQRFGDLEWTMLVGNYDQVLAWFRLYPTPRWLSWLCVKLIIKFSRTNLLSYFESNHKDLFWSTFGHTLLPTKASAVFGQIAILDWWHTSPSFLTKEYTAEALDFASKAGFIRVLEWWRKSRLPLRYTEAALEQASSRGDLEVLEWWHKASLPQISEAHTACCQASADDAQSENSAARASNMPSNTNHMPLLPLLVGKSIIYAAQNGQAATLQWWVKSGIPFGYEASVARIASANGHIDVLQLWKECKGAKMQYDNQVLVGPTKNGHVDVLEWWKQSNYTVEYKTCDIEEALEDSLGGSGEDRIRAWWARNGLNLGVGTSEWMKVKVL